MPQVVPIVKVEPSTPITKDPVSRVIDLPPPYAETSPTPRAFTEDIVEATPSPSVAENVQPTPEAGERGISLDELKEELIAVASPEKKEDEGEGKEEKKDEKHKNEKKEKKHKKEGKEKKEKKEGKEKKEKKGKGSGSDSSSSESSSDSDSD